MEWQAAMKAIETLGFPVVMVLIFLWLDIKRRNNDERQRKEEHVSKEALVERLSRMEDYQRDKMEKMVVENTTAMRENAAATTHLSEVAQEQSQINRQLIVALRTRPCLKDTVDQIKEQGR